MANFKTNAVRILETAKIAFTVHEYDTRDGRIDGAAVAEKMGQPEETVFKTLVTKGTSGKYYVFVIPVAKNLDLKAAAREAGEKAVEMIPVADLLKVTGYVRGGCSPIGMKKPYPVFLDKLSETVDTIRVSAGKIGYQVEMKPSDLVRATEAKVCRLVHEE